MALDESFIEAILEWGPEGPASHVDEWLRAHDLQTAPMVAGLLVTGTREAFESAFDADLERAEAPVTLAVPDALEGAVAAITIPPARRITA